MIDLFSNIFCSDVLDSIKECVYNGCNILIHTNDNNNTFTGISAANFAITPCGIWINYIATKGGHFLKKQYPNGDDQHFEGRGLGLFLIKMIYHLGLIMQKNGIILATNIFLKTPDGEAEVSNFYKRIGFQKISQLPQSFLDFCEREDGQVVDYNDDSADSATSEENLGQLFQLIGFPMRTKSSKKFCHFKDNVITNTVFNAGQQQSRASRSNTNKKKLAQRLEVYSKYERLVNDRMIFKRELASTEIQKYSEKLSRLEETLILKYYQREKDQLDQRNKETNDTSRLKILTFDTKHDYGKYYNYGGSKILHLFSDVTMQLEFNTCSATENILSKAFTFPFLEDLSFSTTKDEQLSFSYKIGVGTLFCLHPETYLTHDMIELLVKIMLRNKESKLARDIAVIHDYQIQSIFDDSYRLKISFCKASKNVGNNLYKKKMWIIVENETRIHWSLILISNPIELFKGRKHMNIYCFDSLGAKPMSKYISKEFMAWMLFQYYFEHTDNTLVKDYLDNFSGMKNEEYLQKYYEYVKKKRK